MDILTHRNKIGNHYICHLGLEMEELDIISSVLRETEKSGILWLRDNIHGGVLRPMIGGRTNRKEAVVVTKLLFPNQPEALFALYKIATIKWMEIK
jgi:hypothetical protein